MELESLNENLYDGFFVEELESRMETDPLGVGSLMDLFDSQLAVDGCGGTYCGSGYSGGGITCGSEYCSSGYS